MVDLEAEKIKIYKQHNNKQYQQHNASGNGSGSENIDKGSQKRMRGVNHKHSHIQNDDEIDIDNGVDDEIGPADLPVAADTRLSQLCLEFARTSVDIFQPAGGWSHRWTGEAETETEGDNNSNNNGSNNNNNNYYNYGHMPLKQKLEAVRVSLTSKPQTLKP